MKKKFTIKKEEIEKLLLPRLQKMGFLLLFFSLASLSYAIFAKPYASTPKQKPLQIEELEEADTFPIDSSSFDLSEEGRINFYAASIIFCAVGITCLIIARKKAEKKPSKDTDCG